MELSLGRAWGEDLDDSRGRGEREEEDLSSRAPSVFTVNMFRGPGVDSPFPSFFYAPLPIKENGIPIWKSLST